MRIILFFILSLSPQLKELEDEWAKLDPTPPQPNRFTRTEQAKRAAAPPPAAVAESTDGSSGGSAPGAQYWIFFFS